MLDYDPSQIEITGVEMPENGGVEPWFEVQSSKFKVAATLNLEPETLNFEPETLNLLQIGWMSMEPVRVAGNGTLLLIHARLTEAFRISHITPQISHSTSENSNLKSEMQNLKSEISFALSDSPLSELADAEGNVIPDVTLLMPTGESRKVAMWQSGKVVCYPTPARETLNIEIVTESDGPVSMQLVNMQGIAVLKPAHGMVKAGFYKNQVDLRALSPGVYFMRTLVNEEMIIQKIVISR
jgi:hypothetical protein